MVFAGYAVYDKLRNEVLQRLSPPNCVVYLSATPEICHERVGIRGRVGVIIVVISIAM